MRSNTEEGVVKKKTFHLQKFTTENFDFFGKTDTEMKKSEEEVRQDIAKKKKKRGYRKHWTNKEK